MLDFVRKRRELLLHGFAYPALILLVNLLIVNKELRIDYTAYLLSNEGTFLALAKNIAAHPTDMLWWPLWDLGLPYQNTYLPGLHIVVAAFMRLTGHAAALSFHQVAGLFYAFGPVAVYFMAWGMTRRAGTSWFAALAYSIVSPCAWLVPAIRDDINGPWNLRRLQILAFYGEGPHTACLFFVPLAILFLYLSVTRRGLGIKIAAGALVGLAVLMNAFAATILGMAAVALLAANPGKAALRSAVIVAAITVAAYLWISPLLPPSVAAVIRRNSSAEYPFNAASWMAAGDLALAFTAVWFATRYRASAPVRMFLLFAVTASAIVLLYYFANASLVPQSHRYAVTMDMALCLSAVFGAAALFRRLPRRAQTWGVVVLVAASAVQVRHGMRYARGLIQGADVTQSTGYHLAVWVNENLPGERVLIGGSHSFHADAFADIPQFHGGHDPMEPNILTMEGYYVIGSGMNTGSRDMEIVTAWLKALGAHAISVPGPLSDPYYKPFPHPERFEGHFPVLWKEGDTTLYAVPVRSRSLAHVVPERALVRDFPINGLDIDEMSRYVRAIEDPAVPEAPLRWKNRHEAEVEAKVAAGQVVSIQERYAPGWRAIVNGREETVGHDGLGLMVVRPDCADCRIVLRYDGGPEFRWTCVGSLLVMLAALAGAFDAWAGRRPTLLRGTIRP
jgi:hypothetical protein